MLAPNSKHFFSKASIRPIAKPDRWWFWGWNVPETEPDF
jgi:hypothetical protein